VIEKQEFFSKIPNPGLKILIVEEFRSKIEIMRKLCSKFVVICQKIAISCPWALHSLNHDATLCKELQIVSINTVKITH